MKKSPNTNEIAYWHIVSFFHHTEVKMPFSLPWHMAGTPYATSFGRLAAMFLFPAWAFFCAPEGVGAMPQTGVANVAYGPQVRASDSPNHDSSEEAAASISGSRWPGIIDHLLQKPLPDDEPGDNGPTVHINYPSIGNRQIDSDIRGWVGEIAGAFEEHLNLAAMSAQIEPDIGTDIFLHDDDLNSEEAIRSADTAGTFELWGNYAVSRPSDAAISITFELWHYTGGAGNLDIITLNYSLLNGQRLTFVDIFEKPETALELMSQWSRKQLEPRLGARMRMLTDGTMPLAENFSSLTLTPDGLCINFQPYQVAQGDAGIQKVEMPLEELREAQPLLALWGRQSL